MELQVISLESSTGALWLRVDIWFRVNRKLDWLKENGKASNSVKIHFLHFV